MASSRLAWQDNDSKTKTMKKTHTQMYKAFQKNQPKKPQNNQQKKQLNLTLVAHAYNPSYSGGRD
jgi:hypothetical protein